MKAWAGVSIVCGVVLMTGAMVMAEVSGTSLWSEIREIAVTEARVEEEVFDAEGISKITVRTSNDAVKIVGVYLPDENPDATCDGCGMTLMQVMRVPDVVRVKYSEPTDGRWGYDVKLENGELIVERWSEDRFFQIFPWFTVGLEPVTIEVPAKMKADIDVKTGNGSIDIYDVRGDSIAARTSNGKIKIDEVRGRDMFVRTSNGGIELRNYHEFDKVDAKTSNGRILLWTGGAEETIAKTSNGRIVFVDLWAFDLKLTTSNGSVEGSVVGKRGDFGVNLKTSNGSVSTNDVDFVQNETGGYDLVENKSSYGSHLTEERDGGNIDIKTSNGDVYLIFSGGQHGDWWLQRKPWWGQQTFK